MLERMRAMPLLGTLSEPVLEKLAHISHEEQYAAGEALFEEGDEGDSMFLLVEGDVVVQKFLDRAERRYKDLAVSEEGDIIGEMSLFDHKPRSATVRARRPLRVLRIYRNDFERFLSQNSASASVLLVGLLSMQNRRLREAGQQNVTMFELVNIIATVQDLRELAAQVVERLVSSLDHVDAAAFCHWNPYLDECEVLYSTGVPSEQAGVLSISRTGPMASMLRERREPFVLSDLGADHPLQSVFNLREVDTVLVAALSYGQDLLGYLLLVGRGTTFTSSHRLMVSAVAGPVASAIVNVRYAEDEQARGRLESARARGGRVSGSPR